MEADEHFDLVIKINGYGFVHNWDAIDEILVEASISNDKRYILTCLKLSVLYKRHLKIWKPLEEKLYRDTIGNLEDGMFDELLLFNGD